MAVFGILDRLIALLRFSPGDVARVTGVALAETKGGNEFFRIYTGTADDGEFSAAELRYALPTASPDAGDLLILTVSARSRIALQEITRVYGRDVVFEPASATAPPDAPSYYGYQRGSVRVSFGMPRTDPARLTTIVLDRSPR